MKNFIKFCAVLLAINAGAFAVVADDNTQRKSGAVTQLEDDIRYHEDVIADSNDSIADIDARIAVLKTRLDSLNDVVKDVKGQVSALEKAKKGFQKDIKDATKARKETFAARDNLVFEQNVQAVMMNPYNKLDVENAMRYADDMETEEVRAKMELLQEYGRYTKDLRDFLEKQRSTFAKNNWTAVRVDSDVTKKFHKGLKGQAYYKIYEKGIKNAKSPSIPYLDRVVEEILVLERQGFNSSTQYDRVVNMLYGTK